MNTIQSVVIAIIEGLTEFLPVSSSGHLELVKAIFGSDYETPDGTAVRDYIHVLDVVRAHHLTLNAIISGEVPVALNIGTGKGFSVKEIIDEIILQTNYTIAPVVRERRAGDVGKVLAVVNVAKLEIGFEAEYVLRAMIKSSL